MSTSTITSIATPILAGAGLPNCPLAVVPVEWEVWAASVVQAEWVAPEGSEVLAELVVPVE